MSEQTTQPADELLLLEPKELIDKFLSDVILPSTKTSVQSREMYKWYEQYCTHFNLGTSSIALFSRHTKTRLQHRRVCGSLEFFCILKPELRAN